MKLFNKNTATGIISFALSFIIFSFIMLYPFFTKRTEEKAVAKSQNSVAYSPTVEMKEACIKISIEKCPADFFVNILPQKGKIRVSAAANNPESKNLNKEKYTKRISFSLRGFENTVNYLGGVEIETPYGLPSPANTDIIIAKDEKLYVYGASLAALLVETAAPTPERGLYYCYALGEVCLKFLKEGEPDLYKFLNRNSETDISYTDYYDNYEYLKLAVKYADIE